jgi:hypothetical protein
MLHIMILLRQNEYYNFLVYVSNLYYSESPINKELSVCDLGAIFLQRSLVTKFAFIHQMDSTDSSTYSKLDGKS